jgi:hypothetical protein
MIGTITTAVPMFAMLSPDHGNPGDVAAFCAALS